MTLMMLDLSVWRVSAGFAQIKQCCFQLNALSNEDHSFLDGWFD